MAALRAGSGEAYRDPGIEQRAVREAVDTMICHPDLRDKRLVARSRTDVVYVALGLPDETEAAMVVRMESELQARARQRDDDRRLAPAREQAARLAASHPAVSRIDDQLPELYAAFTAALVTERDTRAAARAHLMVDATEHGYGDALIAHQVAKTAERDWLNSRIKIHNSAVRVPADRREVDVAALTAEWRRLEEVTLAAARTIRRLLTSLWRQPGHGLTAKQAAYRQAKAERLRCQEAVRQAERSRRRTLASTQRQLLRDFRQVIDIEL